MNYGYNNFGNPYGRGYGVPNYTPQQYIPQQQMPQQPQMQMQQPIQYEIPIQDIRFVTSEEAKAFIVPPNGKVLLIDKGGKVAHLKTADNMGQSVTEYFKFEKINADGTPIEQPKEEPKIDMGEFVKKTELNGFVTMQQYEMLQNQYNALVDQIKVMQNKIVGAKSNGGTRNQQ